MVEDALRSVVGRALDYAAKHGLPGNHHFYITVRTDHPGVDIPDHLRQRYPNEMTIVLQHQFWGLEVRPDGFSVSLSFSDVPESLTIPFDAVAAFADPSVRFGLQFDIGDGEQGPTEEAPDQADASAANSAAEQTPERDAPEEGVPEEGVPEKVVTLDAFRKK